MCDKILNLILQRRIQERAEKERIEAERKKREDAEKLAARRKNVI